MPRLQANFYLYAKDIDRAVTFYQQNFHFMLEDQINVDQANHWAVLRTENALIWLGPTGAKSGLIILVEKNLDKFVEQLKKIGVTIFIPDELNIQQNFDKNILKTEWGRYAWMLDSEDNTVMLFEPAAG